MEYYRTVHVLGNGTVLSKPIEVKVEVGDTHCIATWYHGDKFVEWGIGDSINEAVKDFCSAVQELYRVLSVENISDNLREILDIMNEHGVG